MYERNDSGDVHVGDMSAEHALSLDVVVPTSTERLAVHAVRFSPDETMVAAATANGTVSVHVLEGSTSRVLYTATNHKVRGRRQARGNVQGMDGKQHDSSFIVPVCATPPPLSHQTSRVTCLAWSSTNSQLFSADEHGAVVAHSVTTSSARTGISVLFREGEPVCTLDSRVQQVCRHTARLCVRGYAR